MHPAGADEQFGARAEGEDQGCEVGVVGGARGIGVRVGFSVGEQVVVCCWY